MSNTGKKAQVLTYFVGQTLDLVLADRQNGQVGQLAQASR